MKLHFQSDLDYQLEAIASVRDLFRGQEACRTEFTVPSRDSRPQITTLEPMSDTGNRLSLSETALLENLREVQLRAGIEPAEFLKSSDFSVEMETGTGKTYVYLRTIFELNKHYGFTKFIIVVPSIAIKEGVYETLKNTRSHFRGHYANVPYHYFLYDSARLGEVRSFADSPHIQIMILTVGAINKKDFNSLYKPSEKTHDEEPINLIRETHPVLIVDEPQSVDGGEDGQGKKALASMQPLCTLRYSATHDPKALASQHLVFRLGPVEAYERRLVKQIEIASAGLEGNESNAYVKLLSISGSRRAVTALVEVMMEGKSGTTRRSEIRIQDGDSLEKETGKAVYQGLFAGEISAKRGGEFLELRFPGGNQYLRVGETYGAVESLAVEREMIRRTIREHLDKEKRLRSQGIKVLSLFFIPSVDRYRCFDAEGKETPGEYALIFEEEYRRLRRHPDYAELFPADQPEEDVGSLHKGYFSVDRKKIGTRTVEILKDTNGKTRADEDTYNLIMREKGRLLEFGTPLRFLFSHSALKEGWDNPNVFQICTLRDMKSERQRRQTIGRGLRLCVNQAGDRVPGFEVNILTVIATESYEEFAEKLQSEIEEATGMRFGIVEKHTFASLSSQDASGISHPLGMARSEDLWNYLRACGWIGAEGKILDALRLAVREETFTLPPDFCEYAPAIRGLLSRLAGRVEIRNADQKHSVRVRKSLLYGSDFQSLWDRIKYKTRYHVEFDSEALIRDCAKAVAELPPTRSTRIQWRKADLKIDRAGVAAVEIETSSPVALETEAPEIPDFLTVLQEGTRLTRRTLAEILSRSGRLNDFKRNPQELLERISRAVNHCKRLLLVKGICYERLGDSDYYGLECFEDEMIGYLKNLPAERSVYDHVFYESETERRFMEDLERNEAVKLYVKLPRWFRIPTPLGDYIPDWAILLKKGNGQKLYFVVETKSSILEQDLRGKEKAKSDCGRAHFKALASPLAEDSPQYILKSDVEGVIAYAFPD